MQVRHVAFTRFLLSPRLPSSPIIYTARHTAQKRLNPPREIPPLKMTVLRDCFVLFAPVCSLAPEFLRLCQGLLCVENSLLCDPPPGPRRTRGLCWSLLRVWTARLGTLARCEALAFGSARIRYHTHQ